MREASPALAPNPGEADAVALAATTLHETFAAEHLAGNPGATYSAAGSRCGMPKQHVGELCNPVSGRTAKIHKIVMMGPRFAAAYFRRLAAKLEERSGRTRDLRDAALGVQEAAGSLARCVRAALVDEHINDMEDAQIEAALLTAEAEIAAVRAARAQHRARGGAR